MWQRATANVVVFDLDNTLFDRAAAYRMWATRYVDEAGRGEDAVEWFREMDEDGSPTGAPCGPRQSSGLPRRRLS